MAKKKSKTQKYKRNVKKKLQKAQIAKQKSQNQTDSLPKKENQLVPKEQVKYNVVLHPISKKEKKLEKPSLKIVSFLEKWKKKITDLINQKKENQPKKRTKRKTPSKKDEIVLPKLKEESTPPKKRNIFIRLFINIKNNLHIFFNSILIITFIIMITGLIRINIFENSTIIYIGCIILFLMLVAISYNKYMSGKVFTIILVIGMSLAIYQMQYTYDFIGNLNSAMYEYKTYYVVTFDNGLNKSIYNINNKKVGLLKDNCINIERKLNTKLNKVSYIEYEDINSLFDDFYEQKYRAILVNENQYKYLENNIQNNRKVKILYEFKANAKK